MKKLILSLIFLFTAAVALAHYPTTTKVDAAMKKQPAVPFNHAKHGDTLVKKCDTCHHTEKGLTDIAMRRYISDVDRALNRWTLPLFGSSKEARALAMYAEDEGVRWTLRFTDPDRPRPFRVPWVPVTPIISILACLYLMLQLPRITWIRFGIWLAIGVAIYFLYGYRHSRLRRPGHVHDVPPTPPTSS